MKYAEALRNFRRMAHVHSFNWCGAVLCANRQLYKAVFDEAVFTMNASSMPVTADNVRMILRTKNGATLRFYLVAGPLDAYELAGNSFTQMIFVGYESPPAEQAYLRGMLRSSNEAAHNVMLWQEDVSL